MLLAVCASESGSPTHIRSYINLTECQHFKKPKALVELGAVMWVLAALGLTLLGALGAVERQTGAVPQTGTSLSEQQVKVESFEGSTTALPPLHRTGDAS